MGFYLLALAIVLTDQVSKAIVVRSMRLGQSIPLVPGYFDLTFVLNPGAAFSLFATLPEGIRNPFFILISVAAAVLIVVYRARHLRQHRLASVSLGLILGGAVGNLIDRVRYGVVVDFLDVHVHQYHWPVFNVADSAISVGVTLLLIEMLLEWRQERKGASG
ncbi:MAG: signal peptidase II [Acidobacteria bacterium]|jgi:signal peptidase II|nr:MAG: signal peptidase II [Acidobacteriota bacterium]